MPGPVSTGMGDRLRAGKPPRFVTGHSGHATQLSTLSGTEYVYRPKCVDALRLQASKGRYDPFHLWINVWVAGWQVKLCDPSFTRATP